MFRWPTQAQDNIGKYQATLLDQSQPSQLGACTCSAYIILSLLLPLLLPVDSRWIRCLRCPSRVGLFTEKTIYFLFPRQHVAAGCGGVGPLSGWHRGRWMLQWKLATAAIKIISIKRNSNKRISIERISIKGISIKIISVFSVLLIVIG